MTEIILMYHRGTAAYARHHVGKNMREAISDYLSVRRYSCLLLETEMATLWSMA